MATYVVRSNGKQYSVDVVDQASGGATVTVEDESFQVEFVSGDGSAVAAAPMGVPIAADPTPSATPRPAATQDTAPAAPVAVAAAGSGSITAPIPGKVIAVHVSVGATVAAGETVLTLEAMKMENAIAAPNAGTVREITAGEGSEVAAGQLLMVIE